MPRTSSTDLAPRRAPLRFACSLVASLLLLAHAALAQQQPEAPAEADTDARTPQEEPSPASPTARDVLLDPDAGDDQRVDAARAMLLVPAEAGGVETALSALDAEGVRAVARAIQQTEEPQLARIETLGRMLRALAVADARLEGRTQSEVRQAIARCQSRGVVRSLMERVRASGPGPLDASLVDTLRTLTGGRWSADQREAWLSWWEAAEFVPEGDWRRETAAAFVARSALDRRDQDRLDARVRDLYRRLYRATPAQERESLLIEMLSDPVEALVLLAFELGERELLNARALGEGVADAARRRLQVGSPEARVAAASLLRSMGDAPAARLASERLASETDAAVRAALLRLAALAPSEANVETASALLAEEDPLADAAGDFLLAAVDHGVVTTDAANRALLEALLAIDTLEATPTHVALLARFEQPTPRARLRSILRDRPHDPGARLAAARALAAHPDEVDLLVASAQGDDALAPVAIEAVALHRANARGLETIRRLLTSDAATPPDEAELERAVGIVARRASFADLRAIVATLENERLRDVCLEAALRRAADLEPDQVDADVFSLIAEGAAAHLRSGRAARAIEALDVAPLPSGEMSTRLASLRIESLARLSRLDEAQALEAPIDAWLDALARTVDADEQEAARLIGDAIESSAGDALTEAQSARLSALRRRLPASPSEPVEDEPSTDGST